VRVMCAVAVGGLLLSGCADFSTALVTLSDELSYAEGYYYDDEHHRSVIDGDCPAVWEFGRVNNSTYSRIINRTDGPISVTTFWSTGLETTTYLEAGETGPFEYNSGSITPDSVEIACDG